MPISATRVEPLNGTTFELVVNPTHIAFDWNFETNTGRVRFHWFQQLTIDGQTQNKDFGVYGRTEREWAQVADLRPAYPGEVDPVTGADLTQISMRGILKLLQSAFDRAYEQDNAEP